MYVCQCSRTCTYTHEHIIINYGSISICLRKESSNNLRKLRYVQPKQASPSPVLSHFIDLLLLL